MGWAEWDGQEDTMRGDRLALACFAVIFGLGLISIVQSVLLGLGH